MSFEFEPSTRPVSEMSVAELLEEFDSIPREGLDLDEHKKATARRRVLAEEYNGRTELPDEIRAGISSRRVLSA